MITKGVAKATAMEHLSKAVGGFEDAASEKRGITGAQNGLLSLIDQLFGNWEVQQEKYTLLKQTDDEAYVVDRSRDLWNSFTQLPAQHIHDTEDVLYHINAIQSIIDSRGQWRLDHSKYERIVEEVNKSSEDHHLFNYNDLDTEEKKMIALHTYMGWLAAQDVGVGKEEALSLLSGGRYYAKFLPNGVFSPDPST